MAIKESLRENFRQTTAASIGLIQKIYMVFAIVVAFGVVYNNARISLAERARELATLRVIGFSRREVGAVLVTELVVLAMIAVPLGLLAGHRLCQGHHPRRQYGDGSAAARAHRQQLRLCRAGRHHRLDSLGLACAADAEPPGPGQRIEGPGVRMVVERTSPLPPHPNPLPLGGGEGASSAAIGVPPRPRRGGEGWGEGACGGAVQVRTTNVISLFFNIEVTLA